MPRLYASRISSLCIALVCLLSLSGCLEIQNDYLLNPDGSGRVDVKMTFDMSGLPAESIPVDEGVKEFARNLVQQSTGIEVWSDVKSSRSQAGVIVVSGRGYFRDLATVTLDGAYPIGFRVGQSERSIWIGAFDLEQGDERVTGDSLTTADETGTVDIVEGQLEELRILGPEKLAQLGQRITFTLPGDISSADNGFIKDSVNRAVLRITGNRMLELIDSVGADSAFRHEYRYARNFPWSRLLFGTEMPRVRYKPRATPLFDYNREVAAANKRYPQLKRELGIED